MSDQIEVKISAFGNAETGKTSLINRYLTGSFAHQYIQTIGVNYFDKVVNVQGNQVKISLWDIGGEDEFQNMIPMSAEGAHVCMLLFDLTSKSTLSAIKTWYQNIRRHNNSSHIFLVGTKYDMFEMQDETERQEMIDKARKYAKNLGNAPLIFTSAEKGININRLYKLALAFIFGLGEIVEKVEENDKPLFEYTLTAQE